MRMMGVDRTGGEALLRERNGVGGAGGDGVVNGLVNGLLADASVDASAADEDNKSVQPKGRKRKKGQKGQKRRK